MAPFRVTGLGAATALDIIEIGDGTRIGQFSWFSLVERDARVTIGRNCTLSSHFSVTVRQSVVIGDGTAIGERCLLADHGHDHESYLRPALDSDEPPTFGYDATQAAPVVIGRGVHIGVNVVVSPGVEIGDGAVIGANSVVTRPVEPYTVVAGVPARRIRSSLSDASVDPENRPDA